MGGVGKGSYEKTSFNDYIKSPAFNSSKHDLKDRTSGDKLSGDLTNFGGSNRAQLKTGSQTTTDKDINLDDFGQNLKINTKPKATIRDSDN